MSSMISTRSFAVQVVETDSRASKRIIVNAELLKASKTLAGDVVALAAAGDRKIHAIGIIWPSLETSQDEILVSSSLFLTAKLKEGVAVHLYPISATKGIPHLPSLKMAKEALTVRIREIPLVEGDPLPITVNTKEKGKGRDWLSLLLRETLVDLKYLTPTQIVEVIYEGRARRFTFVAATTSGSDSEDLADGMNALSVQSAPRLWIVGWDTVVTVVEDHTESTSIIAHKPEIEEISPNHASDPYSHVGGLDKQILQIRDLLEIPLTRPDLFRYFGLKPPRGILLHGPPGTGKTHLARAIASSTNSSVLIINGPELSSAYHGETESKLREVFREAREKSPCIVVLDEVDALVPRREDGAGGEVEKRVVATLLTILDGMEEEGKDGGGRVVVIGTTNRPNAIDPALRRPGRFDREIEIGIPDAEARLMILGVLLAKTPHSILPDDLRAIAARAHGYVGADLSAVVREAGTIAIKRWLAVNPGATPANVPASGNLILTLGDMLTSLPSVRPSAMRSVFMDTTPVRYADIGGQASVIQKLREAVEWPLLHPEAFNRLGVKPPKGVLLYGPPGCSKTVLVRACASESGVNFVAVKGPELLNKYVGESERGVREIFRKARAAAPSIVFFDEIDALASSRSSDEGGAGSHEGVLTSLLNEMDGVQELVGVTVVAATNRPDIIDSALMRPGRLDRILYVGPPDLQGREDILKIRMSKMSVSQDVDASAIAKMTDGCSGAEISQLCQEAAFLTMQTDINAASVSHDAFVKAAQSMKRQITPDMISKFERWRDGNSVESA